MIDQEGLLLLQPVYWLLSHSDCLNLPRSSVSVFYMTYHNTYKGLQNDPNVLSLQDAVDHELTPGKELTLRFVQSLF